VTQQFLDRPDVVSVFEEMGREIMPQGMACGVLLDVGQPCRFLHGTLKDGFVEVVPMPGPGFGILVLPMRRKNPLPSPSAVCIRVLSAKRFRRFPSYPFLHAT